MNGRRAVAEGARGVATLSSLTPDSRRIRAEGGVMRMVRVPLRPLNDILADVTIPIDFVSIDVEGGELEVLRGFDLGRFKPELLVIEVNVDDGRVSRYLTEHGYRRMSAIDQNIFFERNHDLPSQEPILTVGA